MLRYNQTLTDLVRKNNWRYVIYQEIGTRLGRWTNGPAPFPYVYNSEAYSLDIELATGGSKNSTEAFGRGTYVLFGLIYCGKCGYSLQFQPKENGHTLVKKCQKKDAFGHPCGNRSIELEHVEMAVMEILQKQQKEFIGKQPFFKLNFSQYAKMCSSNNEGVNPDAVDGFEDRFCFQTLVRETGK